MHEFHVGDSFAMIGSNATDNWELIEMMKRSDIWVHMKDVPSCHALVRIPKKRRDDKTLRMNILNRVARMMCIQSVKRILPGEDNNVTFIYTRGKHVRKGAKVGEAILSVIPDEFLVEKPEYI